jgi:hypothetical protein
MTRPFSFSAAIEAWGAARVPLAGIAPLRKKLPAWVPENTAGHFLKYADEQTVAAVAAVDRAIQTHQIDLTQQRDWPIIAAPRFLGRVAGPAVIHGYDHGGPQSVSPHIIPQNSLHSVSGALSILLGSRGPNVGVGGGPEAAGDAILSAFSLPGSSHAAGCWLVATAWDPEPVADRECRMQNEPVCHALALTLRFTAESAGSGELTLRSSASVPAANRPPAANVSVSQLVKKLEEPSAVGSVRLAWTLAWGAEAQITLRTAEQRQRLAA